MSVYDQEENILEVWYLLELSRYYTKECYELTGIKGYSNLTWKIEKYQSYFEFNKLNWGDMYRIAEKIQNLLYSVKSISNYTPLMRSLLRSKGLALKIYKTKGKKPCLHLD